MGENIDDSFIRLTKDLYKGINFEDEAQKLEEVLDKAKKERDVQQYIKANKSWFIPASLFWCYDFGHQLAYIAPEQKLGKEYQVDYTLLGRNSSGWHLVFIEFEDVNVDFKLKNANTVTQQVRKGLTQIYDWKRWIEDNKQYYLRGTGILSLCENIPNWGINYCLVVSRRNRMDGLSNELRGRLEEEHRALKIVSYDRLVDNTKKLVNGF